MFRGNNLLKFYLWNFIFESDRILSKQFVNIFGAIFEQTKLISFVICEFIWKEKK